MRCQYTGIFDAKHYYAYVGLQHKTTKYSNPAFSTEAQARAFARDPIAYEAPQERALAKHLRRLNEMEQQFYKICSGKGQRTLRLIDDRHAEGICGGETHKIVVL